VPSRPTPPAPEQSEPAERAGKGRPTPSRKEAEAARRRPLVPTDRKLAQRSARAASKAARDREYRAMQTGDERYLPLRDKGPVRRWARDYVDARFNIGEWFLPFSLVAIVAMMLTQSSALAAVIVLVVLYLVVLVAVIDAVILARRVKAGAEAKFGAAAVPRGIRMYAVTRAFQIRRLRLPKPQVGRGGRPS
jgi:hypothetical protein